MKNFVLLITFLAALLFSSCGAISFRENDGFGQQTHPQPTEQFDIA